MQRFHTLNLNIQKVDLHKLIAKVTEVFELTQRIRGVKLITSIAENLPRLIATDENRVR